MGLNKITYEDFVDKLKKIRVNVEFDILESTLHLQKTDRQNIYATVSTKNQYESRLFLNKENAKLPEAEKQYIAELVHRLTITPVEEREVEKYEFTKEEMRLLEAFAGVGFTKVGRDESGAIMFSKPAEENKHLLIAAFLPITEKGAFKSLRETKENDQLELNHLIKNSELRRK